jgi:hypothetical protein
VVVCGGVVVHTQQLFMIVRLEYAKYYTYTAV